METYLVIFMIGLAAIASPGPDCLLVLRSGSRYPTRSAIATALGINCGLAVHLAYAVMIVTSSAVSPELLTWLTRVGAAYLGYLGISALYGYWTTSPMRSNATEQESDTALVEISPRRAFVEGLICNIGNPKVAIFMTSVLAQFTGPETGLLRCISYAVLLWMQSLLFWNALSLGVRRTKLGAFLRMNGRTLDLVFGIAMTAFAGELAFG